MNDLVVGMVRKHWQNFTCPLIRRRFDKLTTIFANHLIEVLRFGVCYCFLTELKRHRDLQCLLDGWSLCQVVMPGLNMRVFININTSPQGRVGEYKDSEIGNRQAIPGDKGRSGLWFFQD